MTDPESIVDHDDSGEMDAHGDWAIVRDNTFSRATADRVIPLHLGRDVELVCLQASPILKALLDKGDHFTPDTDPSYTEVARIRLSFGDAIELAMLTLNIGIKSGNVKGDNVATAIQGWIAEGANKA